MLSLWSTHLDDRRRLRLPALRPRLRTAATAASPLSCAHAAAMAEGWVPGLRTSRVASAGGAR